MDIKRLFITRLPSHTDKKKILNVFRNYNPIHAVVLIRNTGNVAYVTFNTMEDAKAALEYSQNNPIKIRKKYIKVLPADSWHTRSDPGQSGVKPRIDPFEKLLKYSPTLPEHVTSYIADLLRFHEKARMEPVSKSWRAGVRLSMAKIKYLDSFNWKWKDDWGRNLITKRSFHWVVTRCLELKSLQLNQNIPIEHQNIAVVAKCCPKLEDLDITGVEIRPSALRELGETCKKLQRLAIGEVRGPVSPYLGNIFRGNSNLKIFHAKKSDLRGSSLGHIPIGLKKLILDYNTLDLPMFRIALSRLEDLEALTVISPSDFDEAEIEALKNNKVLGSVLMSLELISCNPRIQYDEETNEEIRNYIELSNTFFDYVLGPVGKARSLPQNFTNLSTLSLAYNGWVDGILIDGIGKYIPDLTSLDISGCSNIRGEFTLDPLGKLKKLQHLRMDYLYKDVGAFFLRELPTLKTFISHDSAGINDEDICGLLRNCYTIEMIDVEGCVGVERPLIDCVQTAIKQQAKIRVKLDLYVGGTSVFYKEEDEPMFHVSVHYSRCSISPFE